MARAARTICRTLLQMPPPPEDEEVPQERSALQFLHLPCEEEGLELPLSSSWTRSSSDEAEAEQRIAAPSWRKVLAGLALSSLVLLVAAAAAAFQGFTPGHTALHSLGSMDSVNLANLCTWRELPKMWKPRDVKRGKKPLHVRVLTYNLFWWHLFRQDYGWWNGWPNSAGGLVAGAHAETPFDLIGFQECENATRVLRDGGLLEQFGTIQSPEGKCMAYRKDDWQLLAYGHDDVAQDVNWQYYGFRGAGWMRLLHRHSGAKVFFMNHHGPLNVGSGGSCGGHVTASNLAYVALEHGEEGDVVILSGDFNSGPKNDTVKELSKVMSDVYHGKSFGGVDNFFTNLPNSSVVARKNLGGGGSDHDALSVTFLLRPRPYKRRVPHKKAKEMSIRKKLQKLADWADGKWAHGNKKQVAVDLKK